MSQMPISTSPQAWPRRPTPELRVPQPPEFCVLVTACDGVPASSLRVLALLMTAVSTCMKPCMPLPMSSTAVKRMLDPLPSCMRSRFLTSNDETVDAGVTWLVAPVAPAVSYQMLIAPDTVTDDCAIAATGAARAPATATARSFFCIRMLPSIECLATLARHLGNPFARVGSIVRSPSRPKQRNPWLDSRLEAGCCNFATNPQNAF